MKNRLRRKRSLTGVIARQGGNLALVFEKSGIFSGAASEGYGSNPTRQPFFRVSEVSDLTAVLRTDSAEVFTP